jgi:hypothetical protein
VIVYKGGPEDEDAMKTVGGQRGGGGRGCIKGGKWGENIKGGVREGGGGWPYH